MFSNAAFSQSYSSRERVLVECQRPNFLFKLWPPVLGPARGTYAADCTDLADDITNQSREFYCGGPNTLLTRERTINQYRPKSASDLRTRVVGLNYHTRLAGCETCACICAKGKPELWSIVTAEKIGSRSNYILIEFRIIS